MSSGVKRLCPVTGICSSHSVSSDMQLYQSYRKLEETRKPNCYSHIFGGNYLSLLNLSDCTIAG